MSGRPPQYAFLYSLDAASFPTSPSNMRGWFKLSFRFEGQFGVTESERSSIEASEKWVLMGGLIALAYSVGQQLAL